MAGYTEQPDLLLFRVRPGSSWDSLSLYSITPPIIIKDKITLQDEIFLTTVRIYFPISCFLLRRVSYTHNESLSTASLFSSFFLLPLPTHEKRNINPDNAVAPLRIWYI
ncbi:hypothetical protein OUZ56_013492 [Daphnia magna]|uniref:Uncharacterized protein n=1 Tax=Daphnia magna TaxID=35525 RepID=A0ABQ9Z647_9CRUS|nr:hypothetical protein OUZ56_013492 [Daphnia magna]